MKYALTTFGCQMNVHDSDRMIEALREGGHEEVGAVGEADVVLLNTCSVREKAEQKLRSEVGRLAKEKRGRPGLLIVVAGCVAQQEGERLRKSMPAIDLVLGPDNIVELPGLLRELEQGGPPRVRTVFDLEAPAFLPARPGEVRPTAFVTIMKGCDERCSFCVVPYTRGPERYRPSDEIVAEIGELVARGVREVTLLGQTVNSYRDPRGALERAPEADPNDPDESELSALLFAIARRVPGLARLRYTSPHPRHLVPSLIRAHAELPLLPRHVHLPVQSGSNRVLKRMIRRYTREEYLERTSRLRAAVPGLTLSSDVIVGFPGETDDDFEATLSLVREAGFISVFGFEYSERPHTPARKLADDVPAAVKSERLARLFALVEAQQAAHLAGLVGTRQTVLVEGSDAGTAGAREGLRWTGRSERNEIVHVTGAAERDLYGRLVEVEVTRAFRHSLEARVPVEALAALPLRAAAAPPAKKRRALPVVLTES